MADLGHQNQPLPNKSGHLYTLVLEIFIVDRIVQSNRCYSCLDYDTSKLICGYFHPNPSITISHSTD